MQTGNRPLRHAALACAVSLASSLCALWCTSGCQAPPAHVSACDVGSHEPSRKAVGMRQVLVDTGVQFAETPLESTKDVVCNTATRSAAAACGMFQKRVAMHWGGAPADLSECRPTLDRDALEAELHKLLCSELQPAGVHLYPCGEDALTVLQKVISQATCRIDVLMYIWDSDALGEAIATELAAKAGPNLRVRVMVDGGGNMTFGLPLEAPPSYVNRVECWLSHQPYVEVIRTRNPCFHYDHRKLLVVDGKLAFTGGRNFSEQDFFRQRDVSWTLVGPLVRVMEDRFEEFWENNGGQPAEPLEPIAVAPPDTTAIARVVGTDAPEHDLQNTLYKAVDAAQHHVYLENYSLSDSRLIYKLAKARKRGADVRAVLTIESTSEITNHSTRVIANRLLKAGCRVYLYPGMTHVKAMSVDGVWAYTGSGNFDPLSMRRNHEIGIAIADGPLIGDIERQVFFEDFRPEWELTEPLPVTCYDYIAELLAVMVL